MKKVVKYWLPLFVWMGVIFTFSSFPTNPAGGIYWVDFVIKKTAHLVEYGVLATLVYRATRSIGMSKKNCLITSILFAALYGASDEFHQSFTFGREPTIRDVIIDTLGASLAMYFLFKWVGKIKSLEKVYKKLEII
jgi:VanZ family protein